jgi:hypothetical protein
MARGKIPVQFLKVSIPLRPDQIPRGIVPDDGPIKEFDLVLQLEGWPTPLPVRANAKNYRRLIKSLDAAGPDVVVLLAGKLTVASDKLEVTEAGLSLLTKAAGPQ